MSLNFQGATFGVKADTYPHAQPCLDACGPASEGQVALLAELFPTAIYFSVEEEPVRSHLVLPRYQITSPRHAVRFAHTEQQAEAIYGDLLQEFPDVLITVKDRFAA